MRLASIAFLTPLLAAPAMAGDLAAENLFGRDPGHSAAYACFSRTFDEAWLKAHPEQNVADMTVFVARRSGEDAIWHTGNMQIHFRDSTATYHVTADCGGEGAVLGCGVDCDGGGYQMTAISKSELGIKIDDYLRYYDISDQPTGDKTAGFKDSDKNLVVQRTDLRDCLPLVVDEKIKAKIANGVLTQ
jgi:hypothetical protein